MRTIFNSAVQIIIVWSIMQFSTALMVLATLSSPSVSAPVEPRANFDAPPGGDVTILNYALTLEYLERKFYQQGLANYTESDFRKAGFSGDFYKNLKEIYFDEQVSRRRPSSLAQIALQAESSTNHV